MGKSKVIDMVSAQRSCRLCHQRAKCVTKTLDENALQCFDKIKSQQILQRNAFLFRQGCNLQSIYLVRSGSVKSYTLNEEGDEQVLSFYMPGDLIGLDSIENAMHNCSAVALETSSICRISYSQMENLSRDLFSLQQQLSQLYSKEINRNLELLRLLGNKSAEQRLTGFLCNLMQRLQQQGLSYQEFNLSMSRHDIANYLGLAIETISRLLARLQDEQVLGVNRRHITVHDQQQLQQLAGMTTTQQANQSRRSSFCLFH